MSKQKLRIAGMFLLVTTCAMVYGAISVTSPTGLPVTKAAHVPPDSFTAYCDYNPDESVFKAGKQAIYHPTQSPALDTFIILLPIVNEKFNRTGITLLKDDRMTIRACGCVQTGGTGKTWKRYVNPSGANSDKLYHGVIPLDTFIIIPPQGTPASCCGSSPTIPGALRISDMIAAQNRGFQFQIRKPTELVLGYEDDDYGDNGYSGHDDGTQNQCQGVGGAAVGITIRHKV